MGTITITVGDPLPTFDTLYQAMLPNLTFPPVGFQWPPALPGIPTMFPSVNAPNLSGVMAMGQLMCQQMLTTCTAMLKPIIEFLGVGLDVIPKMPPLNLNVIDMLSMSGDDLIAAVKAAIPIPNLYFSISIPDVSVVQYLQELQSNYLKALTDTLTGLIKQVTDKLKIPGMPTIPTLPTMEEVKTMLLSSLPQPIESLRGVDLNSLIANVSIPGIPIDFALPSPLVPTINIPEVDFNQMLANLYQSISTFPITKIKEFCVDKLGSYIGFTFPTLVLVIPTVDITIPSIDPPTIGA